MHACTHETGYHAIGAAPDGFRELAAILMPDVARRRSYQTRHGVLLQRIRAISHREISFSAGACH